MTRPRALALLLMLASAPAMLSGCLRPSYENENDLLRMRILDLEEDIERLRWRLAELEGELSLASAAPDEVDADVRASTPRLAGLEIFRLSHVRDTGPDASTLLLYVEPRDGAGRFLQLTGHLQVNVAVLPGGGDARTIGTVQLDPAGLRETYRSGFSGTHYTIEIPLRRPADKGIASCDVRVVYTDGWTGARHETHAAITLAERGHATFP